MLTLVSLTAFFPTARLGLCAQATDPPSPANPNDVLYFVNGEKLIGKLQRSTGDTVVFKSDMAGEVTVTWNKIKELHSQRQFAVIEKGVNLRTGESDEKIPRGPVSVNGGNVAIVVDPAAPPLLLPLSDTADLIDENIFSRAVMHRPAWYQNWKGAATVGLAAVQATQRSQSYTSSANLIRDVPGEDWMDPETRVILDFSSSYGELAQPDTATVKTSIFHGEGERDLYFRPRLFSFINAQFDHDYSQGLDLQQLYSAGIGWSTIKSKTEQLDLRAALGYENQTFSDVTKNQHLVGSTFSESYNRQFDKVILHQGVSVTPSWSNLNAYSATGDLTLTIPILKRIGFSFGLIDTYLNNASPGFRKNSLQITSGITYSLAPSALAK